LKDNISRLAPVVKRALEEAEVHRGRKRAEELLRASELRYRSLTEDVLDTSAVGIFILDSDFHIVWVNHALERYFGLRRKEVIGKDNRQLIRKRIKDIFEDSETFAKKVFATYDDNTYIEHFECHTVPDGGREERWLEHWSQPIRSGLYAGGRIEHYSDITERKNAEEALRKSERKLRVYNEISKVFLKGSREDMYSEVLTVIRAVTESRFGIFGYIDENENWVCPSLTRDVWDQCQIPDKDIIFPKEKWVGIWGRAMLEKKTLWSNESFKVPEGHLSITCAMAVPVLYAGKLIGNLVLANKETPYHEADVALVESIANHIAPILSSRLQRDKEQREKEKMQEQRIQSQKMEAVGVLAGGVAHDFNNLLTTIIGNAQLVLGELEKEDPHIEDLEEIRKAGERAADLTRQLLSFSRRETRQPELLDLNEALEEMEKMLRRLIREDIELAMIPGPDLWPVYMDPSQMDQIIMNLVVNARDAMPDGGTLTVETANAELDRAYFTKHGIDAEPGPYVMLAVTDTGHGMVEEIQQQMFDPFFTTKERGAGTGLGLATAYGAVKQNGGCIWCYSEPGQGTTMKIYLPRATQGIEPVKRHGVQTGGLTGEETVLVTEDDDAVRKTAVKSLSQYGYHVLEAAGGKAAMDLCRTFKGTIHLLLTDVIMPGMNGKELSQRLRSERPHMKVLFMSGYTENIIMQKGILPGDIHYIQKPFSDRTLARKVREVLGD